jgi:hypothetical protein
MNEAYRPIMPHEKRAWKIRHQPMEYINVFPLPLSREERAVEIRYVRAVPEVSVSGILWLAFLELLNSLSNPEESAIERQE